MVKHKKNHRCLQPFFGIPAHNSKTLQILYPLFALLLVAYSLKIMPESYKLKGFVNSTFSFLQKAPLSVSTIGNILLLSSPFIMAILCIVSFVRTVAGIAKKMLVIRIEKVSIYVKIGTINIDIVPFIPR